MSGLVLLWHMRVTTARRAGMTRVSGMEKDEFWIFTLHANLANWYATKAHNTCGCEDDK